MELLAVIKHRKSLDPDFPI